MYNIVLLICFTWNGCGWSSHMTRSGRGSSRQCGTSGRRPRSRRFWDSCLLCLDWRRLGACPPQPGPLTLHAFAPFIPSRAGRSSRPLPGKRTHQLQQTILVNLFRAAGLSLRELRRSSIFPDHEVAGALAHRLRDLPPVLLDQIRSFVPL